MVLREDEEQIIDIEDLLHDRNAGLVIQQVVEVVDVALALEKLVEFIVDLLGVKFLDASVEQPQSAVKELEDQSGFFFLRESVPLTQLPQKKELVIADLLEVLENVGVDQILLGDEDEQNVLDELDDVFAENQLEFRALVLEVFQNHVEHFDVGVKGGDGLVRGVAQLVVQVAYHVDHRVFEVFQNFFAEV